jgi:hypothetical protein
VAQCNEISLSADFCSQRLEDLAIFVHGQSTVSEEKGGCSACQIGISDLTNELCSNPTLHAKERYGNCRVGLQALVWVDGQKDGWMVASFLAIDRAGVVDSFLVCAPPKQHTCVEGGWLCAN